MICSSCDRESIVTVVLEHRPRGGQPVEWRLCPSCFAPERAPVLADVKPRRK